MAKKEKSKIQESKTFKDAIAAISKQYGKEAIRKLSDKPAMALDAISTGSFTLDLALGIGGIPRGRIIEIFGPESSGKTTLALHIIANAQKNGGVAAFIDAEHALDPSWAGNIGVNVDDLYVNQPDCGEQGLEIVDMLTAGGCDIIVVDSVAALTPRAELDGDMGDSHMGLQARLMSQAMRKIVANTSKTKTTVVFINQIREKIGVMFGNPETTPGGRALKFYSSVRMDIRRKTAVKDGEKTIGFMTNVKIVKNKVAPPFRQSEEILYFGDPVSGLDYATSLLKAAEEHKIVEKSGSFYNYGKTRLGNGAENAKKLLRDNPDLVNEIKTQILAKFDTVESSTPDSVSVEAMTSVGFDSSDGPAAPTLESIIEDNTDDVQEVAEEK